jgi:hypothetical protein
MKIPSAIFQNTRKDRKIIREHVKRPIKWCLDNTLTMDAAVTQILHKPLLIHFKITQSHKRLTLRKFLFCIWNLNGGFLSNIFKKSQI